MLTVNARLVSPCAWWIDWVASALHVLLGNLLCPTSFFMDLVYLLIGIRLNPIHERSSMILHSTPLHEHHF